MEHFSEQAPTYEEAVEKVRQKYGQRAKIYARERRAVRGLFGLKKRDVVHVSGYILEEEPAVQSQPGYDALLSELKSMEKRLSGTQQPREIQRIEDLLYENDFSRDFVSYVLEMLREHLPEQQYADQQVLEQFVLNLISEVFAVDEQTAASLPRVFGVVGPTGVGKTTTIAKIAARFAMSPAVKRHRRVKIITIDSFRIGAREQIRNYGSLMDIPVDTVETPDQLEFSLRNSGEADLILIDTIGKSPRDEQALQDMRQMLSVCGDEAYWSLVLAAPTKERDLQYMAERFAPFGCRSLILTKLDETDQIGNLVSMLRRTNLSLLFATTGQKVPTDLIIPDRSLMLEKIRGFSAAALS